MSKQEVLSAISAMPENVSIEDIMYHLYLMDNVQQGLEDIAAGRTYTTDQVRGMFAQ